MFKQKYLKYKKKYLDLKNQIGGNKKNRSFNQLFVTDFTPDGKDVIFKVLIYKSAAAGAQVASSQEYLNHNSVSILYDKTLKNPIPNIFKRLGNTSFWRGTNKTEEEINNWLSKIYWIQTVNGNWWNRINNKN